MACEQPFGGVEWSRETLDNWVRGWERTIARQDALQFQKCGSKIDKYLDEAVFLTYKMRSVGPAGWQFRLASANDRILCAIWADAQSSARQSTSLHVVTGNETWWPALVIDTGEEIVPVYCPGLAWQRARPLFVQRSRGFHRSK